MVTPYQLEMKDNLIEDGLIQSVINETIKEEVICVSKGISWTFLLQFYCNFIAVIPFFCNYCTFIAIICISIGQSQVKPTIYWIGNGKLIDSAYVTDWIESSPGFDFEIYQAIIINKSLLLDVLNVNISDPEASLDLTCYSSQVYPNGTIFYESSKNKVFNIRIEGNKSKENDKSQLGPI